MSKTTFSAQKIFWPAAGLLSIALLSVTMIKSALSTPLVATFIGLLTLAFIIGALIHKATRRDDRANDISDPIFVNETWILKR